MLYHLQASSLYWEVNIYIRHQEIVKFANDRVNLGLNDVSDYRKQVANLRSKLSSHINDNPDFDLVKSLHSGSVAKGTALKTLNDMDLAIYVKKSSADQHRPDLIEWLVERLKEAYPSLDDDQFTLQEHSARLSFKGSGLDVDVVPILYDGEPDDRGYVVNRKTGELILTSITLHLDFIRARKNIPPNHYAQAVRLLKWWKNYQTEQNDDFRFKSFMIELLLAHFVDKGRIFSDYSTFFEQIFSFILTELEEEIIFFEDYYNKKEIKVDESSLLKIMDPVNPENNVADDMNQSNLDALKRAAHEGLERLAYAKHATTKSISVDCWRPILGPGIGGI